MISLSILNCPSTKQQILDCIRSNGLELHESCNNLAGSKWTTALKTLTSKSLVESQRPSTVSLSNQMEFYLTEYGAERAMALRGCSVRNNGSTVARQLVACDVPQSYSDPGDASLAAKRDEPSDMLSTRVDEEVGSTFDLTACGNSGDEEFIMILSSDDEAAPQCSESMNGGCIPGVRTCDPLDYNRKITKESKFDRTEVTWEGNSDNGASTVLSLRERIAAKFTSHSPVDVKFSQCNGNYESNKCRDLFTTEEYDIDLTQDTCDQAEQAQSSVGSKRKLPDTIVTQQSSFPPTVRCSSYDCPISIDSDEGPPSPTSPPPIRRSLSTETHSSPPLSILPECVNYESNVLSQPTTNKELTSRREKVTKKKRVAKFNSRPDVNIYRGGAATFMMNQSKRSDDSPPGSKSDQSSGTDNKKNTAKKKWNVTEGSWEVVMLIDWREKDYRFIEAFMLQKNVRVEVCQLAIGDYMWVAKQRKYPSNGNALSSGNLMRHDTELGGNSMLSQEEDMRSVYSIISDTSSNGYTSDSSSSGNASTARKVRNKSKKQALQDAQRNMAVLDCIVERKTVSDLASSIQDGRYDEQKQRLKCCGVEHIVYLVEGQSLNPQGVGVGFRHKAKNKDRFLVQCSAGASVTSSTILTAMAATQATGIATGLCRDPGAIDSECEENECSGMDNQFKMHVVQTRGIDHTAMHLLYLHRQVEKRFFSRCNSSDHSSIGHSYTDLFDFQSSSSRSNRLTDVGQLFIAQLRQANGCSVSAAKSISAKFGGTMRNMNTTLRSMVPVAAKDSIAHLRKIGPTGNMSRIGPKLGSFMSNLMLISELPKPKG
eukprot:CAMPEP_0185022798 /NCGR_PEP_ID=MMETSP1103-20130426/5501_1 /TAXON_ID=36769 /ORGANISM="Paraphysomonas bandaiensis, Strain Caron Lab Isolate" /LENGTH=824 /DNA_ID=CAMNT_0027555037 /DNA_START=21 /DNA_END=2495 /DNA_ORIENTATION=-